MWTIEFYSGVENEMLQLPAKLQAKMIRLFELVEQHGANLKEPHSKSLNNGLFELRAKALEGIARGIFCYFGGKKIMVLRVFVKKSQKTPKKELELGRTRMLEVNNESNGIKV